MEKKKPRDPIKTDEDEFVFVFTLVPPNEINNNEKLSRQDGCAHRIQPLPP
jgi:hypothetical protein